MLDHKGYTIKHTYDLAARAMELIEGHLGLNIKVHGNDSDLLNKGQIFLFNHFARFETLIPPYILYRETKTYSRSVAHHSLFTANKKLGKILQENGVVPNNMPGLLPFLAAEILRGRKVVIFPEGSMIKDRRVMDESGELGIFSDSDDSFRKHHRGAAVLALVLDICKLRIKDLFKTNDTERIARWMQSLGFSSPEHLLEQAEKPTMIVPSTITFYPIRINDNFLTRTTELFSRFARDKKLPTQLLEELAVEGNIIFRDTDMDIRLGSPIMPKQKWHWWNIHLMRQYFLNVNSLDELFGLREVAKSWAESMLVRTIDKESRRIRDEYMQAIYAGITVNLSHLASTLIWQMLARGEKSISFSELHHALYFALKDLQQTTGVHLHRGLLWPDRYRGLIDGEGRDLHRFLDTCIQTGLLEKTETGYLFLDKLCAEYDFHRVRLENPLMVNVNEVAPIKAVGKAVAKALEKARKPLNGQELGNLLFDDELLSHARNKAYYSKKRFQEINSRETATRSGRPFLLTHRKPAGTGVLLVHGLLASPAELEEFGHKLHEQGYTVMGVRLAGHGTSPWDLHYRKWEDWLQSVQRGHTILSCLVEKIVIVGFSTGGALGLVFASHKPEKLSGLITVAAPYETHNRKTGFAPLVHGMNRLVSRVSGMDGLHLFRDHHPTYTDINYRSMPISALNELLELIRVMKKALPEVKVPVTVIQGDQDTVVKPEGAQMIFNGLSNSPRRHLHWIPGGKHDLITGDVGETHELILNFIKEVTTPVEIPREPTLEPTQEQIES